MKKDSFYRFPRGGAWHNSSAKDFRAHFRDWCYPDNCFDALGFRCIVPEDNPIVQRLVRIK